MAVAIAQSFVQGTPGGSLRVKNFAQKVPPGIFLGVGRCTGGPILRDPLPPTLIGEAKRKKTCSRTVWRPETSRGEDPGLAGGTTDLNQ